jgi:transcriptional antiterminator RfaH
MSRKTTDGIVYWYALKTKPKQEERADSNLRAWGVETFFPKVNERRYSPYTKEPAYIIKALFPQYIFARFNADKLINKVRFTRGVQSVVSFGSIPTPVDDEIIFIIKSQIREDGFIRIGEEFKSGDKVVVKNGPLRNFIGIFEQKIKDTDRVSILLESVSYQGRIVIERERLKKIV